MTYLDCQQSGTCHKGRYLNDVRTERGRGVTQYVTNTTDRLRECVTKGGRGSKKEENLCDVIYGWSLRLGFQTSEVRSRPFETRLKGDKGVPFSRIADAEIADVHSAPVQRASREPCFS